MAHMAAWYGHIRLEELREAVETASRALESEYPAVPSAKPLQLPCRNRCKWFK